MIIAITILNVFKPRVTIIIMTVITRVYQFWLFNHLLIITDMTIIKYI